LSQGELESSLTDVRAEVYLIEAKRVETERLISAAEARDDALELKSLADRERLITERLDELDAKTAGLRARLEHVLESRRGDEQQESATGETSED